MAEEIVVNNMSYKLYSFTGRVVDQNERSETHVSGGGSYYRGQSLHIDPVTTSIHNKKEFFLIDENGRENHFRMTNMNLPAMRVGHTVQVKWLIREDDKRGPYVMVHNKTLGRYAMDEEQILKAMYNENDRKRMGRQYQGSLLLCTLASIPFILSIVFIIEDSLLYAILLFGLAIALIIPFIKLLSVSKKMEKDVEEMKEKIANTAKAS